MPATALGSFISGIQNGYGADSQKSDPASGANKAPGNSVPQSVGEDTAIENQPPSVPANGLDATATNPNASTAASTSGAAKSSGFSYDGNQSPGMNLFNYLGNQAGLAMGPHAQGEQAPVFAPEGTTTAGGKTVSSVGAYGGGLIGKATSHGIS